MFSDEPADHGHTNGGRCQSNESVVAAQLWIDLFCVCFMSPKSAAKI